MKKLMVAVATLTLLALTTAISPWAPMLALAAGATPSSQTIPNVTTTSGTVFVQTGWNRLTCSSDVYYLLVSAYDSVVTSATGTLLRGPQASNGLPKPAWILVSSNQWLALLLKSGTQATCVVETVSLDGSAGSFTTLAVSSTAAITGNTTIGGTLGVTGIASFSAYTGGQDAGFHNIVGSGDTAPATLTLPSSTALAGLKFGTVTLTSASPSTATATVLSGMNCVCTNQTTQANPVKCAVSSTTLTVTGPNTVTDVVGYLCFK